MSIQLSTKKFTNFFKRYHLTFFIIFIAAVLSGLVLLVNNVVVDANPNSGVDATNPNAGSMRPLHTSSELKAAPTPSPNRSPFTEG